MFTLYHKSIYLLCLYCCVILGSVPTRKCQLNFAVPSEKILSKHASSLRVDASSPGVLHESLDAFAVANPNTDCKISIDGKKISYGYGKKLGEEDLNGHESPPSLREREKRAEEEKKFIAELKDKSVDKIISDENDCDICELNDFEDDELIKRLHQIIAILSNRVREMRELASKKSRALGLLKQKVIGDWKQSKFAPSISHIHSVILNCNSTIRDLLECIDDFAYMAAHVAGTGGMYVRGFDTILHFDYQNNFRCLKKFTDEVYASLDLKQNSTIVKQGSDAWHELRASALVTGSTWYNALGLRGLKDQKDHIEKLLTGNEKPKSSDLKELLKYGKENEINGLATIVGKVIPAFFPTLVVQEEGCEVIPIGDKGHIAISSGDGAGINTVNQPELAIEIKCPKPGKIHTTDVYYKLPIYYSIQVLAEMVSKQCNDFLNLCYNPKSSTVITGKMDNEVWDDIISSTMKQLGSDQHKKPSRLDPDVAELKEKLGDYCQTCTFVAEIPSLRGVGCKCSDLQQESTSNPFSSHTCPNLNSHIQVRCEFLADVCKRSLSSYDEAYNILRRPAKEILVAVVSDLERMKNNPEVHHAVPIAYYLGGFSLKMEAVRGIISEILRSCDEKGLRPKVVAFDGQFLEIATHDETGFPLTLLQLQKKVWHETRSLSKKEIMDRCLKMCSIQNVVESRSSTNGIVVGYKHHQLLVQRNFNFLVKACSTPKESASHEEITTASLNTPDDACDIILQHLPPELIEKLDSDSLAMIRSASHIVTNSSHPNKEVEATSPARGDEKKDLSTVLSALKRCKETKFDITQSQLSTMLKTAESINKSFTCEELRVILKENGQKTSGIRKSNMITSVSQLYGDGSCASLVPRITNPPTLQVLSKRAISILRAVPLAVLYANNNGAAAREY